MELVKLGIDSSFKNRRTGPVERAECLDSVDSPSHCKSLGLSLGFCGKAMCNSRQ